MHQLSTSFSNLGLSASPLIYIDPNRFTDIDNSEIVARGPWGITQCQLFSIKSPNEKRKERKDITATFFDRLIPSKAQSDECLLSMLTEMVNHSHTTVNGLVVCGFDTESGKTGKVELIQLCMGNKVILIHKRSQLFDNRHLRKFFLNELFPDKRIVFAGAELASADALDMLQIGIPIVGLLDLTAVISQAANTPISFFASDEGFSMSLKRMFSTTFGIEWHKDKDITLSDWGASELTLPQIKYAALDAWTSAELGIHTLQNHHSSGIYKMIFSTTAANLAIAAAGGTELLAKRMVRQAREQEDINKKACAEVANMRVTDQRNRMIDVFCTSYGNHLSKNVAKVEIRLLSPGGSHKGVTILADIVESVGTRTR